MCLRRTTRATIQTNDDFILSANKWVSGMAHSVYCPLETKFHSHRNECAKSFACGHWIYENGIFFFLLHSFEFEWMTSFFQQIFPLIWMRRAMNLFFVQILSGSFFVCVYVMPSIISIGQVRIGIFIVLVGWFSWFVVPMFLFQANRQKKNDEPNRNIPPWLSWIHRNVCMNVGKKSEQFNSANKNEPNGKWCYSFWSS